MLPAGQKRQNDTVDHDDSEDDDSENKPLKRNGRRKIKIEYIEDKNRRHITFSKRKAGIMKKAYELSTLTGTQVLLLVVSETGLVYTFTTTKLQPIVTKPEGKNLIQACLNTPDPQPPQQIESQEQTQLELSGSDNQLENDHNTTNDMSNSSNTADAGHPTADANAMVNPAMTTTVQQPPTAANPNSYVSRISDDTSNQLSPQTAASQSPMMPSPNSMSRLPQHPAHASQQPPSFHHQSMNYSQSAAAAAAAAAANGMPGSRYGQSPYGYHQGLPPPPQQQQQPQQHQQIPQANNFSYNLQKTYYQSPHQQAQQQQQPGYNNTGNNNTVGGQPQQQPGTPTPAGYWAFSNTPTAATTTDQNGQQQQQQTATAQLKSIIKQEHV